MGGFGPSITETSMGWEFEYDPSAGPAVLSQYDAVPFLKRAEDMRRRQIQQKPVPPPPIAVIWAEPAITKPGHCPKCGEHVGRAVRTHAETCKAPPN